MTGARVLPPPADGFDTQVQTLIIGAGACGLTAALAAHEAGQQVVVIEADAVPAGSTALSAGLIPAAGTAQQIAAGIADTAAQFAADIQAKAKGENPDDLVQLLASGAGPAIDWLTQKHGMAFSLVTDFDYPGHRHRRMHGLASRAGAELINVLRSKVEAAGVDIICGLRATDLHATGFQIHGVTAQTDDAKVETIGCDKLILACNGFGGNRAMVGEHMPDIQEALWFGHDGNRGEAVQWGRDLGAQMLHLGAYQGHGNVAQPHGILITWATIMEGGVQVNRKGERFWNEAQGYSEAARAVLAQPGGTAYVIFDSRIASIARQFEDFKQAQAVGAIKTADTLRELAKSLGLPDKTLEHTVTTLPQNGSDRFGRLFEGPALASPFCGVRVTGALFHTQGGLRIDGQARVLHETGLPFVNLYAGGGAACGVSGKSDQGYLSGNGLLSALVLGRLAGSDPLAIS